MPTLIALTGTAAIGYTLFALIGFTGLSLAFYAFCVEPWMIVTTKKKVPLPLPQSLRIALVGDFHVGPFKGARFVRRVVRKVNALKPDLVLLVGDFLFDGKSSPHHLAPLRGLQSRHGTFAVLGNHENGHVLRHWRTHREEVQLTPLVRTLREAGIVTLHNETATLSLENGEKLFLAGIDDVWSGIDDLPRALKGVPPNEPAILLSHNPDIILDPDSGRFDLIVSGHTHAGQVRLPVIGPLAPIPQQLGRAYTYGVYELTAKTRLVITRGVGESGIPLRFFAPPEVMLLTTEGKSEE